jgi:hypothetical protein
VWGVKNNNRIVYIKNNICSPKGVFRKKFQKRKRKRKRKRKEEKKFSIFEQARSKSAVGG